MTARGLPHSETRGSKPDCGSPGVSLLVCVLHRLVVPRHPPTAYHILPGHGLLGCRGQRPQRLWLGTSTYHGRYVNNDLYIATYELVKVHRSGEAISLIP
jgi:hypothetical protein